MSMAMSPAESQPDSRAATGIGDSKLSGSLAARRRLQSARAGVQKEHAAKKLSRYCSLSDYIAKS